jgi:hypothetical protein
VKWGSYCKLFEDDWQLMFRERGEREQQLLQEQLQVGQGKTVRTVGEVSRVSALEKRLSDELAEVEKEKEAILVGQQVLQKKLDDLTAISLEREAEISDLKRKLENTVVEAEKGAAHEEVHLSLEDMAANVEHLEANCEDGIN